VYIVYSKVFLKSNREAVGKRKYKLNKWDVGKRPKERQGQCPEQVKYHK
jgi:hypothetical protein